MIYTLEFHGRCGGPIDTVTLRIFNSKEERDKYVNEFGKTVGRWYWTFVDIKNDETIQL